MKLKRTINKSGVFIKEFGALCGVSRIAVHVWLAGGRINPLRQSRVEGVAAALDAAVAAGDMPIDRPDPKGDMLKIQTIVIKHLKLLARTG